MTSDRSFALPSPQVVNLAAFDGRVAWAGCATSALTCSPDDAPSAVYVTDVGSGVSAEVADTRYPHGQISWVGGSGTTVVWLDQDGVPDDAHPTTGWTIRACTIGRCSPRDIASNVASVPPLFSVDAGHLTWLQPSDAASAAAPYDPSSTVDIVTASLDVGRPQVLLHGVHADAAYVDGSTLVYAGPPTGTTQGRELFVRPVDGTGPATPLTGRREVGSADVRSGVVTWREPLGGEGAELWFARIGSPPQLLSRRRTLESLAGDGYVVTSNLDGQLVALPLPTADHRTTPHGVAVLGTLTTVSAHFSVDADTVCWATTQGNAVTLHVSTVHAD